MMPSIPPQAARQGPAAARCIDVLTLFPGLLAPWLQEGLLARAQRQGHVQIALIALRDYGLGPRRNVDAPPYGGGPGMLLRPEPLAAALEERTALHAKQGLRLHRVLLTPQGVPARQALVERWAHSPAALIFICGRYEGFDERIRLSLADEEVSVGDFVCLGGEAPALALMEAVVRLIPGVLGNQASPHTESFQSGLLEHPQYTRPQDFRGLQVPELLRSGNHAQISAWRRQQALLRTRQRRPDLLPKT